jgi:hypothetical protein
MDEDPKMNEMTPRGRKTKVASEPQDWVGLALAISALGALMVAVIATGNTRAHSHSQQP